jgi:hypothetical protein
MASFRSALAAAAAALCLSNAAAQAITSLPGLATMPPFAMYSGYVNYTSPLMGS